MAKERGKGSWLVVEDLLERGDAAFVDELRRIDDADRLAAFAAKWYNDRRPASRRLLLDYLGRPLNAYRHEPLVKRLFKLAEKAEDDEVMAHFLAALDRSIRRVRRKRMRTETQTVNTREAAQALIRLWESQGAEFTNISEWRRNFHAWARWTEEAVGTPWGTVLPRGKMPPARNPRTGERIEFSDLMARLGLKGPPPESLQDLPESFRRKLARFRLFSVHTRHYLRRRAWRYFRKLGQKQPQRYVAAVRAALRLYTDEDAPDGLALLDNWGLVHILFHHAPVLVARTTGWRLAPERSLAELAPAPIYDALWWQTPRVLFDLLREAHCRPVRQWALRMIRRDPARVLGHLPLEELLALLGHEDVEVVALAAEALQNNPGLRSLGVERWLALLETPHPNALETLCALMAAHVEPQRLTLAQVVQLAASRPVPVARLGLQWLRLRHPTGADECRLLLGLTEAQSEPVRPELVHWAREVLSTAPSFEPAWVLEYLDSRHQDVRTEGWQWLQAEPRARDNVELWRKLLESPYDDVRLQLVADLEQRTAGRDVVLTERMNLDAELVRFLWAAVLLNIQRGSRVKPQVVQQVVRRLNHRPADAGTLLPLLSVALRSIRGPEWRAGLTGVVQWLERHPEMEALVQQHFPELRLAEIRMG
jgi:hypothetical protein